MMFNLKRFVICAGAFSLSLSCVTKQKKKGPTPDSAEVTFPKGASGMAFFDGKGSVEIETGSEMKVYSYKPAVKTGGNLAVIMLEKCIKILNGGKVLNEPEEKVALGKCNDELAKSKDKYTFVKHGDRWFAHFDGVREGEVKGTVTTVHAAGDGAAIEAAAPAVNAEPVVDEAADLTSGIAQSLQTAFNAGAAKIGDEIFAQVTKKSKHKAFLKVGENLFYYLDEAALVIPAYAAADAVGDEIKAVVVNPLPAGAEKAEEGGDAAGAGDAAAPAAEVDAEHQPDADAAAAHEVGGAGVPAAVPAAAVPEGGADAALKGEEEP